MSFRDARQAYSQAMARGKTEEMTAIARKEDKASHAELNRLRTEPCNAECFDCTARKPGWAALPHGIFICIECAQLHRLLGRHVSQTKAINTGTYLWHDFEIRVMREVGNGRAAHAFRGLPPKPSKDAPPAEKEAYVRAKYEQKRRGPFYEDAESDGRASTAQLTSSFSPAADATPKTTRGASKPVAGLAGARRLPPSLSSPQQAQPDLITMEAAVVVPKTAPKVYAVDDAASAYTAMSAKKTLISAADKEIGAWEAKKAAILAQFSPHEQVPQDNTRAFFALYGL